MLDLKIAALALPCLISGPASATSQITLFGVVDDGVVHTYEKKNDKGKIEIEYYSKDELERIIELFESIR